MLAFKGIWDAEYLADLIDDGMYSEMRHHISVGYMSRENYDAIETKRNIISDTKQQNIVTVELPNGKKLIATITVEEVDGE